MNKTQSVLMGTNTIKLGRNDPCHCGSGKKYKKCCLEKDEAESRAKAAAANAKALEEIALNAAKRAEEFKKITDARDLELAKADLEPKLGTAPLPAEMDPLEPDWPEPSAEEKKITDAWWDEVGPIYLGKKTLPDKEHMNQWLLEHALDFLERQPQIFRYLYLHEEFLFELGARLARDGRIQDYIALLLRLKSEQPEVFEQCFGYYERDILVELIHTGKRQEIPKCFEWFHRKPEAHPDQRNEIMDILAWQGLEPELRQLVEPLVRAADSSAEAKNLAEQMDARYWLSNLIMEPFLKSQDTSPEAIERLRKEVLAVGYWKPSPGAEKNWLEHEFRMAALPPAEAKLDFTRPRKNLQMDDISWNFSGWAYRTKGLPWCSARFLAMQLNSYWLWKEQKTHKKSYHLEKASLDSYLASACRDLFWVSGVKTYATLQALSLFIDYLSAFGQLNAPQVAKLRLDFADLFKLARLQIDAIDPGARLYPDYPALIQGVPAGKGL